MHVMYFCVVKYLPSIIDLAAVSAQAIFCGF